jgi:hypothetical protein
MQVEGSQGHGSFSHPFYIKEIPCHSLWPVVIAFLLFHKSEPHTTPLMDGPMLILVPTF